MEPTYPYQIARVIEDAHQLFIGGNSSITAGIQVQAIMAEAECEQRGYQYEWGVNTYSLRDALEKNNADAYGLTPEELTAHITACEAVEAA